VKKTLPFALLVAAVLATFAPLAASGKALVYRDLVVYTAPQDAVLREAILERHELPRRNPYIYAGVAHLADPSTQTLYPPRVLCALLFAPPRSIHVFVLLHFVLAALGGAFFARTLGASRPAAAAAGAVYALSGPVLSLMENLPLLAGATWLPFVGALARRARVGPGGRTTESLLAAVPIGLIVLGGDLQAAVWACLLAGGILLARRNAKGAALAPILGLLLGAAVLVPAFELRPETDRPEMTAKDAGAWSLAPARLVELALPFPFGVSFPDRTSVTDGLGTDPRIAEPWAETIHVGVVGLALGAAALFDRRRRKAAALLLLLGALALAAAMGPRGPYVWALLRLLPFYSELRHPEKHAVLFALAAAPLAALGIDAARRAGPLIWIAVAGISAVATVFALPAVAAASHRHVSHSELAASVLQVQLPRAVFFLALAAGATLVKRRRLRRALLALLVVLDVLVATHPRVFAGDATLYDEHPTGAQLVRSSGSRVIRLPWGGASRVGRLPTPEEMPGRSLEERAIAARVRSWAGSVAARERVPAAHGMSSFMPRGITEKSLDELGVRYVVSNAPVGSDSSAADFGVVMTDRGAQVAKAPPVSFAGDVPGLLPGALGSLLGAVLLVVFWHRPRRSPAPAP
jgi:hypothetical protein